MARSGTGDQGGLTAAGMSPAQLAAELEILRDVVARLEHAGLAYMLTGSSAMSYYAVPRMRCARSPKPSPSMDSPRVR